MDGVTSNFYEVKSEDLNMYLNDNTIISLLSEYPVKIPSEPLSPKGPPSRENYEGLSKFKVEIDSTHTKKKKFLYSHQLNRIYVDINNNFFVRFSWDINNFLVDTYIRATVVFSDVEQAEKRVERCLQHSHESCNAKGLPKAVLMNVLHSGREFGSPDVHYCGDPDRTDSWYSVVVRTPQPTELSYLFVCKNSCSSGINRRPIDIIFTLEDLEGTVYGRQVVGARVCSCPRRDIKRDDELEAPKGKRPIQQNPEVKSKKIKLEVVETDDVVIKLPISVVGKKTAILGLEVMLNMMEQRRLGMQLTTETATMRNSIDTSIANLKKQINQLRGHE